MDDRRTITTGVDDVGDDGNPLEGMFPVDLADAMLDEEWVEQFGRYITPEMLAQARAARAAMDEEAL